MKMIPCQTEDELEAFVLFFFEHRSAFAGGFTVMEAVGSLSVLLAETETVLFYHRDGELLGALNYTYGTREHDFHNRDVLFIDSALIKEKFRNTRSFVQGFRQFLRYAAEKNPLIKEVQFHAYRHDVRVHRLYQKLSIVVDTHEDEIGEKDVFSRAFSDLKAFLDSLS